MKFSRKERGDAGKQFRETQIGAIYETGFKASERLRRNTHWFKHSPARDSLLTGLKSILTALGDM